MHAIDAETYFHTVQPGEGVTNPEKGKEKNWTCSYCSEQAKRSLLTQPGISRKSKEVHFDYKKFCTSCSFGVNPHYWEDRGWDNLRLYFVLYHEATLVNLFEVFFYYNHCIEFGLGLGKCAAFRERSERWHRSEQRRERSD
jgi:hypothetical protein